MSTCETGGMQEIRKTRWSLPSRLRDDGWWLGDAPRANPAAILIPFIHKRPPTVRPDAIRKARS